MLLKKIQKRSALDFSCQAVKQGIGIKFKIKFKFLTLNFALALYFSLQG